MPSQCSLSQAGRQVAAVVEATAAWRAMSSSACSEDTQQIVRQVFRWIFDVAFTVLALRLEVRDFWHRPVAFHHKAPCIVKRAEIVDETNSIRQPVHAKWPSRRKATLGFSSFMRTGTLACAVLLYGKGRTKFRGSLHNPRAVADWSNCRRFLDESCTSSHRSLKSDYSRNQQPIVMFNRAAMTVLSR